MTNVELDLDLIVVLADSAKMYMHASAIQLIFEHMVGRFILLSYEAN